jgi:hypothetical protein
MRYVTLASKRFETLEVARSALRRLGWTRVLFIKHLCIEDRIVLALAA